MDAATLADKYGTLLELVFAVSLLAQWNAVYRLFTETIPKRIYPPAYVEVNERMVASGSEPKLRIKIVRGTVNGLKYTTEGTGWVIAIGVYAALTWGLPAFASSWVDTVVLAGAWIVPGFVALTIVASLFLYGSQPVCDWLADGLRKLGEAWQQRRIRKALELLAAANALPRGTGEPSGASEKP